MKHLLVTGGAGFIGSNFVKLAINKNYRITVLDALTYAGHRANLRAVESDPRFRFVQGRIEDGRLLEKLFSEQPFDAVVHFAAESHVDNSILGPQAFVQTNIVGTFELLEASRRYLSNKPSSNFRFVHVSTDEVFGALGETGKFSETTAYAPNSPYSATKASSDLLARAWFHTYNLPVVTTNCSNNYGPQQFPEKLIPRMITNALAGKKLPVYGKGLNIRDWIHVEDHCNGVLLALEKGRAGEAYCFGGNSERTNIQVVENICASLDRLRPQKSGRPYAEHIEFVTDRLGHDFRYAIDDQKAQTELGFCRAYGSFENGLQATIRWYLENGQWLEEVQKRERSK